MNILYLNNEMTIGGVAKCILILAKELSSENKIFIASKEKGALLDEFKKIGINNISLYDVENKSPFNMVKNVIKIVKIVKENNIDIIHSHHRMTTLLAKIASKFVKVKVIHTQHLCIEDKFKLTNLALKNIRIITVSESAKRILVEKSNLNGKKITTIYNTIETSCKNKEVDTRLIELKNKGYFIVAQVSRIIDYKGVYDFIEVAKKTGLKCKNIKFFLIGDGPELDNVKKTIIEQNLEETIYILGAKNNVIEHLKYIDILLLCSYIEGLPLAPLEAFSQGVPVIATNIDGTNEEIIDGENGYLVNVKDTEGFKNRILYLYNNKEKFIYMKEKSKEIFYERFNHDKYIQQHRQIYKKLKNK
ncbi:glycosyltransferase [Clostridium isatidis]|uniref:glycosyltransferase n=1 Tax=Clostridium isatidis TaxID=182773 RepID=UPI003AAFDB95